MSEKEVLKMTEVGYTVRHFKVNKDGELVDLGDEFVFFKDWEKMVN